MSHSRRERRKLQRELKKIDKTNQFSDLLSPDMGKEIRRKYLQKIKNEELEKDQIDSNFSSTLEDFSAQTGHDYQGLKGFILNRNWDNID
jgi:hypothetical protein